jgi:HSP20 family molecular chaperone IbpA
MSLIHWDPFRAIRHRDDFLDEFFVDSSKANAALKNGILTITVAKSAQAQARRVGVTVS